MNLENIFTFLEDNEKIIIPISFVCIFILIVILANYFSEKQKVKRILTKLPNRKIISLRSKEFSRVTGTAKSIKEPFIAPLSKRKCVFYRIKIEQEKSNGKSSSWETLVDEERFQEFILDQNGEYVIVGLTQYPKNFLCHLVVDEKTSSRTFKKPMPEFESLLNHYNIKSKGFLGINKSLRYSEAIIELGEKITVAGKVKYRNLDVQIEGYNYSKIVELVSTDQQKIIITDLPNIKSKRRV